MKTVSFRAMYSYEWKEDVPENQRDTAAQPSRPFCAKMMELGRYYTRKDIESISARLGYSVWDRCGGEGCRHKWVSHIVKVQGGESTEVVIPGTEKEQITIVEKPKKSFSQYVRLGLVYLVAAALLCFVFYALYKTFF